MGLFDKLFGGLGKTRQQIDLEELFQGYAPDSEEFYENLEEMLILSDAGMETAERVDYLMHRKTWEDRYRKGEEAREGLIKILTGLLDVGETELKLTTKPSVILMVGVNGVGKTTTIGKLAHQLIDSDLPCRGGGAAGHLGGALRGGLCPPRRGKRPRGRGL